MKIVKRKGLFLMVALLVIMSIFTACGASQTEESSTNETQATNVTKELEPHSMGIVSKIAPNYDPDFDLTGKKIIFITKMGSHPFFIAMKDGAQIEAQRLGITCEFMAAIDGQDMNEQGILIENAISQHPDAICYTVADSKAMSTIFKKANDAGIKIITLDARCDDDALAEAGAHIDAYVGSNNYEGGKIAGEYIADLFMNDPDNVVEIAVVDGPPGNESTFARTEGFKEGILKNPKLKIVAIQAANSDINLGMTVTQNMIQANPNIKAIWGCNDLITLGALEGLRSANKLGQVVLVGLDGLDEAIQAVRDGDMTADVAQAPRGMGVTAIDIAYNMITDPNYTLPDLINYTTMEVIDSSNVEGFIGL